MSTVFDRAEWVTFDRFGFANPYRNPKVIVPCSSYPAKRTFLVDNQSSCFVSVLEGSWLCVVGFGFLDCSGLLRPTLSGSTESLELSRLHTPKHRRELQSKLHTWAGMRFPGATSASVQYEGARHKDPALGYEGPCKGDSRNPQLLLE